jgi:hypothetical protein
VRAILNWLLRHGASDEKPPATRLSASSAIELAKQAAGGDLQGPILSLASVEERSGRLVWIVAAPVMGRTLEVEVDDQTGAVLAMNHRGIR